MSKGIFKALLHCFTSGEPLAHTAIELGVYISFSGVLTFKNSQSLRDIAKKLPLSHLLVETDAPFLAPIPHRGKRNEPAYVVDTARVLAGIKEVNEAEIARQTTENALRLFSKMPPLEGGT
jgi:TatD DNase family protein